MQVKPNTTIARLLVFFLLTVAICKPLRADDGTLAQRRACEPDVFRLCSSSIPDHTAITNCLWYNLARLNPDCRAVFEGNEHAEESGAQYLPPRKQSGAGTLSGTTSARRGVE
jgi:hypothetical protein